VEKARKRLDQLRLVVAALSPGQYRAVGPVAPSRRGFDTHGEFVGITDIYLIAGPQTLHEGLHL
jgi:hypothetical protein